MAYIIYFQLGNSIQKVSFIRENRYSLVLYKKSKGKFYTKVMFLCSKVSVFMLQRVSLSYLYFWTLGRHNWTPPADLPLQKCGGRCVVWGRGRMRGRGTGKGRGHLKSRQPQSSCLAEHRGMFGNVWNKQIFRSSAILYFVWENCKMYSMV